MCAQQSLPVVETILAALAARPDAYLVAIAGIPGSGKSTVSAELCRRIPGAVLLPMDGYHLRKSQLDAEGLRRRGARHTFNSAAFCRDLRQLKATRSGQFPAFDHAEQDPRWNAISVSPDTKLVIVEGLYVLMHDWQLEDLFDLKIFLDCDLEVALTRVAQRHLACGLADTLTAATTRAQQNDRLNALDILEDGCRERADLVVSV
jgi:pantothenate kinase